MKPVSIAIVGCGALSEDGYFPALALTPEIRCEFAVDVREPVAKKASRRWRIPRYSAKYKDILGEIEGVVLSVPNDRHESMAIEALERGRAVLCEKPLARNAEEAKRMVEAARRGKVDLAAAMVLRQNPILQRLREEKPWVSLGPLREIHLSYGRALNWPASGPHLLDKARAGGGVLIDLGVHALDAFLWVFSLEKIEITGYQDDSQGGVECEAVLSLEVRLPRCRDPVSVILETSRLRPLSGLLEIRGKGGDRVEPLLAPSELLSTPEAFSQQLRAWALKIRGLDEGGASAEDQVEVLDLIGKAYALRSRLSFPWQEYGRWA